MLQEIYTISHLYHTSPPPLPRLLQLKLRGQTSTSTTPPKCGKGCKKYILHLTSTTPLPHLYHAFSNSNYWDQPVPLPHPQNVVDVSRNIYYISPLPHLSPTSNTPSPIKTRLGQLGANISPDRSSLTPQVLIGNFLKHNYPLLHELQHINLLCLYLPKEDGVSPDTEYITQIIFSIFLQ